MKVLAFDLDGTTILRDGSLSQRNERALRAAAAAGVLLVPATGRMKDFIPPAVMALPIRYIVASNGASVYDLQSGEMIYTNWMPNAKAREVYRLIAEYDLYVEFYTGGPAMVKRGLQEVAQARFHFPAERLRFLKKSYTYVDDYTEALQETGLNPEKINLPYVEPFVYQTVWDRLAAIADVKLTSSMHCNIEINAGTASKGDALRALAPLLGVTAADIMAVGDNDNDLEMLRYAGISFAMGNAELFVKEAAKRVTAPYDEDGLAQAIEQVLSAL